MPGADGTVDAPTINAAHAPFSTSPGSGVMNHADRSQGGAHVRRIGKSSNPDHPFHPCDDVDSDDP
eukprot:5459370-Pleurochrysis_carterae.AAC.1